MEDVQLTARTEEGQQLNEYLGTAVGKLWTDEEAKELLMRVDTVKLRASLWSVGVPPPGLRDQSEDDPKGAREDNEKEPVFICEPVCGDGRECGRRVYDYNLYRRLLTHQRCTKGGEHGFRGTDSREHGFWGKRIPRRTDSRERIRWIQTRMVLIINQYKTS